VTQFLVLWSYLADSGLPVPKTQGFERGLDKHAVGNGLVNSPSLTALHIDSKGAVVAATTWCAQDCPLR
jgi:hypothetical protein